MTLVTNRIRVDSLSVKARKPKHRAGLDIRMTILESKTKL